MRFVAYGRSLDRLTVARLRFVGLVCRRFGRRAVLVTRPLEIVVPGPAIRLARNGVIRERRRRGIRVPEMGDRRRALSTLRDFTCIGSLPIRRARRARCRRGGPRRPSQSARPCPHSLDYLPQHHRPEYPHRPAWGEFGSTIPQRAWLCRRPLARYARAEPLVQFRVRRVLYGLLSDLNLPGQAVGPGRRAKARGHPTRGVRLPPAPPYGGPPDPRGVLRSPRGCGRRSSFPSWRRARGAARRCLRRGGRQLVSFVS